LWAAVLWVINSALGCAPAIKTIVVPVGAPFILLNPVEGPIGALVETPTGEWMEGKVDQIPAGWACWYPGKEDFAKP
jgi:hypothetical protein